MEMIRDNNQNLKDKNKNTRQSLIIILKPSMKAQSDPATTLLTQMKNTEGKEAEVHHLQGKSIQVLHDIVILIIIQNIDEKVPVI